MSLIIGQFNDSFPPITDGVANTVYNYTKILNRDYGRSYAVIPYYKNVVDNHEFDVYRYWSVPLLKSLPYRGGVPLSPPFIQKLCKIESDLLHAHSPFSAGWLARFIAHKKKIPVIATYHTKFEQDFSQYLKLGVAVDMVMKYVASYFESIDDVWVVNDGTGKALQNIGYKGDYFVMQNGADFTPGKADEAQMEQVRQKAGIKPGQMVFLFVGRMVWQKNLRIVIQSLKLMKDAGLPFHMLFVGNGYALDEMKEMVHSLELNEQVYFAGPVYDRDLLKAYYSVADLFLFPSSYDNAPIVIREAAACGCPSVLVEGTCSAEGVTDRENGFLTKENAEAFAQTVLEIVKQPELIRTVGENASQTIFMTWEKAVAKAVDRYHVVIERYQSQKSK